ncbi:NAD(P)H-binding protein [Corallococcus terminator]|nr:NAD(P)H-binding protein [Corallococcus terminator]
MRILLTGATGLAGSEVLRQALADADVERVTVLSRRPLALTHAKLDVVLHTDFTRYDSVVEKLTGHAACLWCLGTSQTQVTKAEYEVITYDYAVAAATAMAAANPALRFCFLSGRGTDSTEQSRTLFARVKGRTENELLRRVPETYCFRPAFIHPVQPHPGTPLIARMLGPLAPLMKRMSHGWVADTDVLGRAMLKVAKQGAPKHVLENEDILRLGGGLPAQG